MVQKYNDYTRSVTGYLSNYNKFKIAIENMEEDKKAKLNMLNNHSVPIAKYSDELGGGSSELNQTEAAASMRIKLEDDIKQIELNIDELQRILIKIDRAIEGLNDEYKKIVNMRTEGYSWERMGDVMYCSGKWAKNKYNKAVDEIAFMMFGQDACPKQLSFCFISTPKYKNNRNNGHAPTC